MKEMDSLGLRMCRYQGELFELSAKELDCSSAVFIRRFMNSDLAKRMDEGGILFDSLDLRGALGEIEDQYGETSYGEEKFSLDELYWIGYIYRYWAIAKGKSSKQIHRIAKPDYMRKLFFPYHSLDPLQAIDRILEDMPPEAQKGNDDIVRGVAIMKKVREKRRYQ